MSHTRSSDSVRSQAASAYTGSSARTCGGRHSQCQDVHTGGIHVSEQHRERKYSTSCSSN